MSVISANISFKRGGHELLDFSSIHDTYKDALIWAKDENSNAAIGQFIYIKQEWQDPETSTTYSSGAYVVETIGDSAVLTFLAKSTAGGDIASDVAQLKKDVALKADKSDLEKNYATKDELSQAGKVKDVTVNGTSVLSEAGTAVVEFNKYSLTKKENAAEGFAAQYDFATTDPTGQTTTITIDIPKDQFLKSADFIASATSKDQQKDPQVVIGDPYLKFVFDTINGETVTYVSVKKLVDTYTVDGTYIKFKETENHQLTNEITLDIVALKTELNKVYADKSTTDKAVKKLSDVTADTVGGEINNRIGDNIIDATLEDWTSDKLDNETKAIQAKALKTKFGAMAENIDTKLSIKKIVYPETLPVNGDVNVIYLHDEKGDGDGKCTEKLWIDGKYHTIGSTIYYTKAEIDSFLKLKANAADLGTKADDGESEGQTDTAFGRIKNLEKWVAAPLTADEVDKLTGIVTTTPEAQA